MRYAIIHRHGYGGNARWLRVKTFATKAAAVNAAAKHPRGGYKVVPASKLKKTRHPYLYDVYEVL